MQAQIKEPTFTQCEIIEKALEDQREQRIAVDTLGLPAWKGAAADSGYRTIYANHMESRYEWEM